MREQPRYNGATGISLDSYHDFWERAIKGQIWYNRDCMNEWLHNLPLWWMAVVIFTIVYLAAGAILAIIMLLAKGERAHVFKRVSPGMLSPLGTVFGLLVVFSIFQLWGDFDRARMAVDREASAIRTVVLLATSFPGEPHSAWAADLVAVDDFAHAGDATRLARPNLLPPKARRCWRKAFFHLEVQNDAGEC
jgi:hypothetical protein